MAASLGVFASAFGPRPITYRTIDFRTNEFRGLEGGDRFEPVEDNPMIGYRGALPLRPGARPVPARAVGDRQGRGTTDAATCT